MSELQNPVDPMAGAPAADSAIHPPKTDAYAPVASRFPFLTPSGAGLAAICFFMPWVRFDCMGAQKTLSGADLANREAVFWLALAAAVAILAAVFYFRSQGALEKARPVVWIASLAGMGLLLVKYFSFSGGEKTPFGSITPKDIGLSIQPGAVGVLIGFALALIGVGGLKSEGTGAPGQAPPA
jgi:hypothetical protein